MMNIGAMKSTHFKEEMYEELLFLYEMVMKKSSFSPSEMVARVKAHLSRYERLVKNHDRENEVIEIRGMKIDKTARRVYVNDEEKILTTKEFDLLSFLAGHPDRVYTKDELFREIWDMESFGDIATVTVHIKKIREKIEEDPQNPTIIKTVRGLGYRVDL